MVGTGYLGDRATLTGKDTIAAVLADIVKSANVTLIVSQHDNGLSSNAKDKIISRVRQDRHQAGKQPAPRPNTVPLRSEDSCTSVILFIERRSHRSASL
jgi:hypothetical protein